MDEFDEFSEHRETRLPGQMLGEWVRKNRILILYGALLIAVMFSRGLWGHDELWTAELTRDLLDRGKWLQSASGANFPGEPSILYLWLTKLSAMPVGLAGQMRAVSAPDYQAWLLRIPSVFGSIVFLYYFRRWASRFLQGDVAGLAMLILCATPLWFWQSQAVQVDLLFSAMLGWSWLCWLAGYLLLRRQVEGSAEEHKRWFRSFNLWLGFAFLIKGTLPIVLSVLLLIFYLVWQKDLKALKETVMNWGFAILLLFVTSGYAFAKWPVNFIHHVLHRFLQIQPIWIYAEYLARDLFPWVLLLPALIVFLRSSGAHKAPTARFLVIAFLVPFSISIWGDGTRGTDPLVAYPFLTLLMAGLLQPVYVEGVSVTRIRRIGAVMAAALWSASFTCFALSMIRLGGSEIQGYITPMLGSLRLATLVLAMGALSVSVRCFMGEGEFLVRETTATVCVVLFIIGVWGFHGLDSKMRNQNTTKDPNSAQLLE